MISKQPSEHGLLLEGHQFSENNNEFDFKRQSPSDSTTKTFFGGKTFESGNHKLILQNSEEVGGFSKGNDTF